MIRKMRIDPRLDALGWKKVKAGTTASRPHRIEEYGTVNGPADYALGIDAAILAVVEAKKLTVGPQNVLTQAERYSKGATANPLNFGGYRVPFLYSTNGEVVCFRDARHALNRSRRVGDFHSPATLTEMMRRDFDAAVASAKAVPNDHPRLRAYQMKANAAVERASPNASARCSWRWRPAPARRSRP